MINLQKLVAALAFLGSLHIAASQSIATAQVPSPPVGYDDLPLEIRPLSGGDFALLESVSADVSLKSWVDPIGKRVSIQARHRPSGAVDKQHHTVSFFPLRVLSLSPSTIAVAGVNSRGFTVIERWDLAAPAVGVTVDPITQEPIYSIASPPVVMRDVAFASNQPAHWGVSAFCRDRGSSTKLLVLFSVSKEVYTLDLVSGTLELEVSTAPQGSGNGFHSSPFLHKVTFSGIWSRDHSVHGHVVCVTREGVDPIILIDHDSDGVIDQEFEATNTLWEQLGLGVDSSYLN